MFVLHRAENAGAERARPMNEIVDEIKALADKGTKEVTCLGKL